ncbi:phage tail protein [Aerococcaceae bacterium zg-ZJ1578]|uniref:major tail protein n=1 Tax=Aerococcaceae bacterium zg-252 TaxID=2796928 RepID=UPI001A30BC82|nr:phage tail protein [Aerococcaceae bacterium zg-1578]
MARIGVDNLFAFPIKKDDRTGTEYGEAFKIAKTISINVNPQTVESSLYADDGLAEYQASITAYDISINVDDLTPEVKGKLLGYKPDENGMIVETDEINAPFVAIAFRSKRSDGSYEYRVLYKVRFNPTEDRYETQGQNITFQTPTITGKSMRLESTGAFGAHVVSNKTNTELINKWFTAPVGKFTPGA